MKKYNIYLTLRILLVVLFTSAVSILVFSGRYNLSVIAFVLLIWSILYLYKFQKRTIKDMHRFIDAIKFSEANISFRGFEKEGLTTKLSSLMEEAVGRFSSRLFQTEVNQQFYNSLLNRIDEGILVVAKSGDIEWINKAALDEFGKPQPRHISDLQQVFPELPNILETILPKETKIVRIKTGNVLRQLAITAVLFIAQGKEMKLVSVKNIEAVVEESENEAWKKLIRVLTHEMMNSITPIISLSESFSEQNDETDTELVFKAMETIHRRSKGLVEFVHNYQKLTRIPNPEPSLCYAKDILDGITRLLNADGVKFKSLIEPSDMQWNVDRIQMEQVLINLIKNAWESCNNQSVPDIKIQISQNEYQQPVISISDNGIGILPEVLDKIFIPFFTTKQGGSGIGLSICRQIISAHGGTISVESESGKGSCFTIRL